MAISRRARALRRAAGPVRLEAIRWTVALGTLLGAGSLAYALAPSPTAQAAEQRRSLVTLAEVASRVDAKSVSLPNLTELLRADVETELSAIDWAREGARQSYLISASVVRLKAERSGDTLHATCAVSATIRDKQRGTLIAIVEGRARAEQVHARPGAHPSLGVERDALSGAAQSTVGAIAKAIRQAR